MPRQARAISPTGLYHVTSRAIEPLRLFADARDCELFRHGLARTRIEGGWRILAYCLMGTHFHVIAGAEPEQLARAMRRLKGWYAHEVNDTRGRTGAVFDARYAARPLASEAHAGAAVVYVAVNPVRAGLRRHPDEWPFGSHRAHAGLEACPAWLEPIERLGVFSNRAGYREAIDAAVARIHASRRAAAAEAGLAGGQTLGSDLLV